MTAPDKPDKPVHPGSYCAPDGATGKFKTGRGAVCSALKPGDRARWRASEPAPAKKPRGRRNTPASTAAAAVDQQLLQLPLVGAPILTVPANADTDAAIGRPTDPAVVARVLDNPAYASNLDELFMAQNSPGISSSDYERVRAAIQSRCAAAAPSIVQQLGTVGDRAQTAAAFRRLSDDEQTAVARATGHIDVPYGNRADVIADSIVRAAEPRRAVADRVRTAYRTIRAADQTMSWVGLADLRAALPDVDRGTLDDVLIEMLDADAGRQDFRLMTTANSKALRETDHAAAIDLGGQPHHAIYLSDPGRDLSNADDLNAQPQLGTPAAADPPAAAPTGWSKAARRRFARRAGQSNPLGNRVSSGPGHTTYEDTEFGGGRTQIWDKS